MPRAVILSPSSVILSPFAAAQGKLREGSFSVDSG